MTRSKRWSSKSTSCFLLLTLVLTSLNPARQLKIIEKDVFSGATSNRIFYLALPPSSFAQVSAMIKKHNYASGQINRLVIEKPFGKDTDDCRGMIDSIGKDWKEEEVWRIDHYLGLSFAFSLWVLTDGVVPGEEMVREIYHLRFANSFVEPLLSNKYVEAVSVVMKETFGAEGRGGYFDEFGMIRDVGQNRKSVEVFASRSADAGIDLLQSIAIMMMDAPTSLTDDSLRANKVRLLQAMPPVDPKDVVLGQYAAAKDGPREDGTGKAYVDDETVPDGSKTATFAQWAMRVDNERWKGVPVVVKCGKGECRATVKALADVGDSAGQGIDGNDVPPPSTGEQRLRRARSLELARDTDEPGAGGIFQGQPAETRMSRGRDGARGDHVDGTGAQGSWG